MSALIFNNSARDHVTIATAAVTDEGELMCFQLCSRHVEVTLEKANKPEMQQTWRGIKNKSAEILEMITAPITCEDIYLLFGDSTDSH